MHEIEIDENTTYAMSIVICYGCNERWLAIRPEGTRTQDLECPSCGPGLVFETGEEF
jgi:hypothetical protein